MQVTNAAIMQSVMYVLNSRSRCACQCVKLNLMTSMLSDFDLYVR